MHNLLPDFWDNENSIAEIMFIGPGRTPGCGVFKEYPLSR